MENLDAGKKEQKKEEREGGKKTLGRTINEILLKEAIKKHTARQE